MNLNYTIQVEKSHMDDLKTMENRYNELMANLNLKNEEMEQIKIQSSSKQYFLF